MARNVIAERLFTIPHLLSPAECEQLIARSEQMGFSAASVATASGPQMLSNVRNNDRVVFEDAGLVDWLWTRVRELLPAEPDDAVPVGLNERLRFYRYDPSQRFNAHRDGTVMQSPSERSRYTFLIYLNSGAEGGQTVFYSADRVDGLRHVVASINPQAGMGLLFAHDWWHEGAKVVSGRKYVLRSDVFYRDADSTASAPTGKAG